MLSDKTAVITGGARGIGREIALIMAGQGADIALVDTGTAAKETEDTRAQAAALGVKAVAYGCAVEDEERVIEVTREIAAAFGRVDILVNNAGITKDNLLLRQSAADFSRVLEVNLQGAFHFIRHLARPIMRSPQGRIINISSVAGLRGNSGQVNYAASKAGLIGLTKAVARELAGRGVTCNAIAPGFIETAMTAALPEQAVANILATVPLGRPGRAAEVAALALFLASPAAAYITGEVIRVDGGLAM
jgi:3-oxoacyl-[acyl-carrier protein] reductase